MGFVLEVLIVAICLSAAMGVAWLVAERTGRSGWIDAIWTFATGIAGFALALWQVSPGVLRPFLVAGLTGLWSLRLCFHIVSRTARGGDDPRYKQLRVEWGDRASGRLFWFLQVQAAAGLVLALSIAAAARRPEIGLDVRDALGIVVFGVAIFGESTADRQVARFGRDPKNQSKICDVGLWGFSRHPNYFFEWLVWAAFALIAIAPAGHYPWGWFGLAAPVLMYVLLVHVSGIPPLEAHMLRSRGDAFRLYQARVNAFWPGPPRSPAEAVGSGAPS
jgi:steroid 5-alpha reductase family enzyme